MQIDTDRIRQRVADAPEDERLAVSSALDRYDELVGADGWDRDALTPIVEAASSRLVQIGTVGMHLVFALARKSSVAADALLRLTTHDHWYVRLRVFSVMDGDVPPDLATELVRFGLRDRSSRVRVRASEKLVRLELDLVDELRDRAAEETHGVARQSLEDQHSLATLGYRIEHREDGRILVWVPLRNGWMRNGWSVFEMTPAEMAAGRLPERVAETRRGIEGAHS